MRHHPDKLKDLLPAGDEAWAQHVVHAEGLGGRGGRRSRVVRGVRELLAQLQVVQDEPVAVVGYAQTVRGLAIGGGGKVGADPGGQPGTSVRALGQQRPVQRAQRGVNPVEVAAPVRGQKAVGQADLVDGEPGVALQVQGLSQTSKSLSEPATCGCPRRSWSSFSLGSRPSGGRRAGGRLRRRCSRRCSHTSR